MALNGWTAIDEEAALGKGRRVATLEWIAERRGLDPSSGVLFYRAGRAWILATQGGTVELGAATWGPRTYDRDVALREAWRDAVGRPGEPEVDAIRAKVEAWSTEPVRPPVSAYPRPSVSVTANADREQLALLGRRG